MLRRIIAIAVIVIGLAALVGAVGSATFWRPADRVTATMPTAPGEPVVVTAPGVLDMVDDTVDVRVVGATADTPVVLAMGREADVHAWIGDAAYTEITGLTSWEELSVQQVEATPPEPDDEATEDEDATEDDEATDEAEEPTLPDPSGSDLWIEEVTGTGELNYQWSSVPGRWVMLVASDGTEPAPQVELTWNREVQTPLLVPGLIVGGVLVLAGVAALVMILLIDREAARARRARAESELSGTAIPARREGRHRDEAPAAELTYAQRLGWPATDMADPAGPADSDATSLDPAADAVPTDTGELPTTVLGEDGTPLTRRELREQERARLEAERANARPWWRFGRAKPAAAAPTAGDAPVDTDDDGGAVGGGRTGDDGPEVADGHASDPDDDAGIADDEAAGSQTEQGGPALSDWISTGRTGAQAGPIHTYTSLEPGVGLGSAPDAASTGTAAAGVAAEEPSQDRSAPSAPEEQAPRDSKTRSRRRRLWGRRSRPEPVPESGPQEPETEPEEQMSDDPHSSGARWRRTWGIQQDPGTVPRDTQGSQETQDTEAGQGTEDSAGPDGALPWHRVRDEEENR